MLVRRRVRRPAPRVRGPGRRLSTSPEAAEARKRRQLVVNRRRATALLALTATVFVVTAVAGGGGWVAWVRAAAEASTVGGLADWFAVTALFRHPLGVPIPHTAIIPERKDQFGETMGHFVQANLLTPAAIVERVRSAAVATRLVRWFTAEDHAARVARQVLDAAVAGLDVVDDEAVHHALEKALRERLDEVEVAPVLGRLLTQMTDAGRHEELLTAALRGAASYLDEHRDDLRARFGGESPWWLPGAVEDRIFERLVEGALSLLRGAADDPASSTLRRELELRLRGFAADLQTSAALRGRARQLQAELLDQPQLREWVSSLWRDAKAWLRAQAADPASELQARATQAIVAVARRTEEDPALVARLQDGIERAVLTGAERYGDEIADLVRTAIARWDGRQAADRLELLLGPDLQYIRINGTVVGGVAGVALYGISRLVG